MKWRGPRYRRWHDRDRLQARHGRSDTQRPSHPDDLPFAPAACLPQRRSTAKPDLLSRPAGADVVGIQFVVPAQTIQHHPTSSSPASNAVFRIPEIAPHGRSKTRAGRSRQEQPGKLIPDGLKHGRRQCLTHSGVHGRKHLATVVRRKALRHLAAKTLAAGRFPKAQYSN